MARKYNPKKLRGSWTGKIGDRDFAVQFAGFMDDSMIEADYDEDQVTEHVDTDGNVTLVLNPNSKATVKIKIAQGSPINDELSNLVPNARLDFMPVGVFTFEDLNGTTKIKAPEAWIRHSAPISFGKQVVAREWTFGLGEADLHVGGAAEV